MFEKKYIFAFLAVVLSSGFVIAEDGYELWLRYKTVQDEQRLNSYREKLSEVTVLGEGETIDVVGKELADGLSGLLDKTVPVDTELDSGTGLLAGTLGELSNEGLKLDGIKSFLAKSGSEGFGIVSTTYENNPVTVIAANKPEGLLYGSFAFLRRLQTEQSIENLDIQEAPKIKYRVIDHWDNIDGSTERVYSDNPRSIWWDYHKENPSRAVRRWKDYGRACASIGINMVILNNVNSDAEVLATENLEHVKKIADTLRPYGIRVGLSANVASCLSPEHEFRRGPGIGNLDTADPMNPDVVEWWKNKISEIYNLVPDFAGFLIKAGSEGMPGPRKYDRTAAQAANMYGDLLEPYGGIVMWRTFTYGIDEPDPTKHQYIIFAPQDGEFDLGNIFVQTKFGSRDFMPREPFNPLFGCMPDTQMSLELQITQEYTGHDKYLMFWAPLWKEILNSDTYSRGKGSSVADVVDGSLYGFPDSQIAGVSNVSRVRNWTGHHFAQANWYAFGRLAWDNNLTAREMAEEWVRQTWGNQPELVSKLTDILVSSHQTTADYVGPLGIAHTNTGDWRHYEPTPYNEDYWQRWFVNATSEGIGIDRTSSGTNAVGQYQPPVTDYYADPESCPSGLILWFHRYGWEDTLPDGKTVWQSLIDRYNRGIDNVQDYIETWKTLEKYIDNQRYEHVLNRLKIQDKHARKYRRLWLSYFNELNGLPLPDDIH